MSTETHPAKTGVESSSSLTNTNTILFAYLLGIAAQLPLLYLYCKNLWIHKPHYQFIPFAIGVVAYLAWSRWPRETRLVFHKSILSDFLLVVGLSFGLVNCLFIEPWLAAISCIFLASSLLARTYNSVTTKSLVALSLPLFVCLVPPKRGDMTIITTLQQISAKFTSQLLDLVGYGHHMPGTVIKAPGTEGFGIAEACSGVQSFFTLLFVAVVFAVWNRRPWFRALLLMCSAVFWAIFMNTVRIFAIPMADRAFGLDLSSGLAHMLLGYFTLAVGIVMLFSTDQFLMFLFGPVDPSSSDSRGMGKFIAKTWNKVVAGDLEDDDKKKKKKSRQKMSALSKNLVLLTAGLMLVGGLWQLVETGRSLFSTNKVQFFTSVITQPLERTDLPAMVEGWKLQEPDGYYAEDREHGSDHGMHSDTWVYLGPRFPMLISLDQTFPGWHELTICYQNQGWKLEKRTKKEEESKNWSYIEAEFTKNTGEKAFLVFSLFDAFGEGYDAPQNWETIDYLLSRVRNRLTQRVRASLFRAETFQTQAFVRSYREISDEQKEQITSRYLKLREQLRVNFMKRRGLTESNESAEPVESASNSSAKDAPDAKP